MIRLNICAERYYNSESDYFASLGPPTHFYIRITVCRLANLCSSLKVVAAQKRYYDRNLQQYIQFKGKEIIRNVTKETTEVICLEI